MFARIFTRNASYVMHRSVRNLTSMSNGARATNAPSSVTSSEASAMTQTPRMPQLLGYAGTLPFLVGALATTMFPDADNPARATQIYGSAILSFLGGVHWGIALRGPLSQSASASLFNLPARDFFVSVVPSLVGSTAAIAPPHPGLAMLASSFAAFFVYDRIRLAPPAPIPAWYIRIRAPLSIAAAGGCAVAWLAVRRNLLIREDIQEILEPVSEALASPDSDTEPSEKTEEISEN